MESGTHKITIWNLHNLDIEEVVHQIGEKRVKNAVQEGERLKKMLNLFEYNIELPDNDSSKQSNGGFYYYYSEALVSEKNGELRKAAELYWDNIYQNGTDAPASFIRLLIVLNRLEEYEIELKIAKIYRRFVYEKFQDSLDKKIARLEKKIEKINR